MKPNLLAMSLPELEVYVQANAQPKFRARQIQEWLLKGVPFEKMENLPKAFRTHLQQTAQSGLIEIVEILRSQKDETEKYLFLLTDGNVIEGVSMRYHYGTTLCVSSQVGCAMACAFCASAIGGKVRDLAAHEMLAQVIAVNAHLEQFGQRVHNVVIMGSGEPLDNYDNTVSFLRQANSLLGIGIRNISVSTCGLVQPMLRFAQEGLPVTLSLSLHAADDETRMRIMPIAHKYSIAQTLEALWNYTAVTNRRAVIEYAMIAGVNDTKQQALQLAGLLANKLCHVNVIPLNSVKERSLFTAQEQSIAQFMQVLQQNHISVTRRRSLGEDIEGACGQLRRKTIQAGGVIDHEYCKGNASGQGAG